MENGETVLMPIDEIGETFFRVIFRAVVYFVVEILWWVVCFYIGLPVVKLVTLGKYPDDKPTVGQEVIISTVGFLILLFGAMWVTGLWR